MIGKYIKTLGSEDYLEVLDLVAVPEILYKYNTSGEAQLHGLKDMYDSNNKIGIGTRTLYLCRDENDKIRYVDLNSIEKVSDSKN